MPVPNHPLDQEACRRLVYPRHPVFQWVSLDVDGDHLNVEEVSQAYKVHFVCNGKKWIPQ